MSLTLPPLSRWQAEHMTEDEWAELVTDTAVRFRWRWAHFRPARTANGWRTPQSGDHGFPDLTLARAGVLIVAELKAERYRWRPGQREWLTQAGEHARLWKPSDWPRVWAELSAPSGSAGLPAQACGTVTASQVIDNLSTFSEAT